MCLKIVDHYISEYKLGTFTRKLSRPQIFKLAKDLPIFTKWGVDLDKSFLKDKYSLSSNDLNKALDIIKVHYETSALIGIRKNLVALDDDLIKDLCDIWVKFHPKFRELYNQKVIFNSFDGLMQGVDEMNQHQELKDYWYPILMTRLTKEHVADLAALYYFARDDLRYSERYLIYYEVNHGDLFDEEETLDKFNHIFSKSDFLTQIVIALFFLYQTDLAKELSNKYSLED